MARPKVDRTRLSIDPAPERIVPPDRVRLVLGKKPIPVEDLRSLPDIVAVLARLEAKALERAKPRAYALEVLPFLRHCAKLAGITLNALASYKDIVRANRNWTANTKSDRFGYALAFTAHLQVQGVIAHFNLPKNIGREDKKPTPNFYVLVPSTWTSAEGEILAQARGLEARPNMDRDTALAVATIQVRMRHIEAVAVARIETIYQLVLETGRIIEAANSSGLHESMRRLRSFPKNADLEEAIVWATQRHGGILPSSTSCDQTFYEQVKHRHGGFPAFRTRFHPTSNSLAPFFVRFLTDPRLAPNVDSVIQHTCRDCMSAGEEAGTKIITIIKKRPNYKEISRELPIGRPGEWTLPRATEFLLKYTGRLLDSGAPIDPRVDEGGSRRLFVHYDLQHGKWITRVDPSTASNMVRRFMAQAAEGDPLLQALSATVSGENFRPSHGFVEGVIEGSIFAVQATLAHESANTTRAYTDNQSVATLAPQKLLGFQTFLAEQIMKRREELPSEAVDVGNGFHCRNPEAGPDVEDGEICAAHESCDQGCVQALLVLEDTDTAADWIRWEQHIESERPRLEADYAARWNGVWKPRLETYQVLLGGLTARTRAAAKLLVEHTYVPMPPLT